MTSSLVPLKPDEAREKVYQDVVDVLIAYCEGHPTTSISDILSILGKVAGYCVGLQLPERREDARDVVTSNMDMATKETAGENS